MGLESGPSLLQLGQSLPTGEVALSAIPHLATPRLAVRCLETLVNMMGMFCIVPRSSHSLIIRCLGMRYLVWAIIWLSEKFSERWCQVFWLFGCAAAYNYTSDAENESFKGMSNLNGE